MPIQTSCPSCGKALRVPDDLLGKDVKCPSCQTQFVAGAAGLEAPPALPSERRPEQDEGIREQAPAHRRSSRRELDRDDEFDDDDDRPRRRRKDYAPHRGTMILIFGILGWVVCIAFGIAAWVMGNHDMKEIRAGRMDPEGESMTNIGRILGMVQCIFACVVLVFYCIFIIAMGAGGGFNK